MSIQPIHLAPIGASGFDHRASLTCPCGPVASFTVLETGGLAYRHRQPPAVAELSPVLAAALSAYRGGATTPTALAFALGLPRSTAGHRLDALADLGLVP